MLKNLLGVDGRMSRNAYRKIMLYLVPAAALFIILGATGVLPLPIAIAIYVALAWIFVAQSTRRCHDKNRNGFYLLHPAALITLLATDGDAGENDFGSDPQQREFPWDILRKKPLPAAPEAKQQ